jgi:hypothetical protein
VHVLFSLAALAESGYSRAFGGSSRWGVSDEDRDEDSDEDER